mmetsp:Transcript_82827/g.177535  ORF Transcript_82827/g.177535 Transcript_82827/m.177535 type:complete len:249 (-) Transcript_82827:736-1482(-)
MLARYAIEVFCLVPFPPCTAWGSMVKDAITEHLLASQCGAVAEEGACSRTVEHGLRSPRDALAWPGRVADDVVALCTDELLCDHEANVSVPLRCPAPHRVEVEGNLRRLIGLQRPAPHGVIVIGGEVHLRVNVVVVQRSSPVAAIGVCRHTATNLMGAQDASLHIGIRREAVCAEAAVVQEHTGALIAAELLLALQGAARARKLRYGYLAEVIVSHRPEHRAPECIQLTDVPLVLLDKPRLPCGLCHI